MFVIDLEATLPEVDEQHVVGVCDVGRAESGVEQVEVEVGRDVAVAQLLGHQALGLLL